MSTIKSGAIVAATLAGVAGVLVLNPTTEVAPAAATGLVSPSDASGATTDPTVTTGSDDEDDTTSDDSDDTAASATTAPSTAAAPAATASTATYTGAVYSTPYGPMQVEATIANGEIVDISWISLPADRHSQAINNQAAPQLVVEALAARSAQVNSISGATYTSAGFKYSLQSILDQVGL